MEGKLKIMYVLGMDGGGSKSTFCLLDEKGNVISRHVESGCYILSLGLNGVVKLIEKGVNACIPESNQNRITFFAAMPSYSYSQKIDKEIHKIRNYFPFDINFSNDVEAGHAGALAYNNRVGINIVSGTGSIAYGKDESGNEASCGGWGHRFFCDEGSGYDLGIHLIKAFTKQSDGREERTLLYESLKKHLGLTQDYDIFEELILNKDMDRKFIASLALLYDDLIKADDPVCKKILNYAAEELALHAFAIADSLSFKEEKILVSATGGVVENMKPLYTALEIKLYEKNMLLKKPDFDPALGACFLGCIKSGIKVNNEFLTNVKKTGGIYEKNI